MIRSVLRAMGSLRLTLALIVTIVILLLSGLFIPQRSVLQSDLYLQWKEASPGLVEVLDLFGLTHVYTSPMALILWSVFFVNLVLVMWSRVHIVRSLVSVHPGRIRPLRTVEKAKVRAELELGDGTGLDEAARFFEKLRCRVLAAEDALYAVRYRLSPVATLAFHLSFILILVGGLVSHYSRFTGRVEIAEGERITGHLEQYVDPPRLPHFGQPPSLDLMVEHIEAMVQENTPVGVRVTLKDRLGVEHVAEVNRPYREGKCSLVIQELGVAPLVVIIDENGREVDGAWVKLDVLQGKRDRFELAGLSCDVAFFPDLVMVQGRPQTGTIELKNPAFELYISAPGSEHPPVVLRPGEGVLLGSTRLQIPEMRYWVRFYVRQESGLWMLWIGLTLASAALVWRLVFYRREYWVATKHREGEVDCIVVAGRSEFFHELFREDFDITVGRLGQFLEAKRREGGDR